MERNKIEKNRIFGKTENATCLSNHETDHSKNSKRRPDGRKSSPSPSRQELLILCLFTPLKGNVLLHRYEWISSDLK